jgi:hypothetical protein
MATREQMSSLASRTVSGLKMKQDSLRLTQRLLPFVPVVDADACVKAETTYVRQI